MAAKLGLNARLYRNTGTYNSPAFVAVNNCKDLTLNLEKNSSDVTTRANNGWRAMVGVLKDGSIDFKMVDDTTDTNFTAIRAAFINGTDIEFLVLDEAATSTSAEGLRAVMMVEKFTRNESLEEAITYDVTIRPTYAPTTPPIWVTGNAYGAYV